MITPSQCNVPCTIDTCPISRHITRTRVVARHVTSPAAVCPRYTSVPLLTPISYPEDYLLNLETARSHKVLGSACRVGRVTVRDVWILVYQ
jgi:hypothetical protein